MFHIPKNIQQQTYNNFHFYKCRSKKKAGLVFPAFIVKNYYYIGLRLCVQFREDIA